MSFNKSRQNSFISWGLAQFHINKLKLSQYHCRNINAVKSRFHTSYFSPTLTLLAVFPTSTCASASRAAGGGSSSFSPGTTTLTSDFFRKSLANSVITAHLGKHRSSEIQFRRLHSYAGGPHQESSELWRPLQTTVGNAVTTVGERSMC